MLMASNKTISNYARKLPIINTTGHFAPLSGRLLRGYVVTSAKCAQFFVFEAAFFMVTCKGRGCLEVLLLQFERKKKNACLRKKSLFLSAQFTQLSLAAVVSPHEQH